MELSDVPKVPLTEAERHERHVDDADAQRAEARSEQRALAWLALAAAVILVWIAMPVGVGVLLGTLIAFTLQPFYDRIRRTRLGNTGAALVTVLGSGIALVAAVGGVAWLFVSKGSALAREGVAKIAEGGGPHALIANVAHFTERAGVGADQLEARARGIAESIAASAATIAERIVSATAGAALGLFFAMLAMYFILRNWATVAKRAQETLPLRPDYTRALFDEFRRVGRTTLLGTVITGIAQGVFATIGYVLGGVPEPVFFGALTAAASLLPAVGTMLVWVPAGVVLILAGHPLGGVVVLAWSLAVVVGVSDYVIRPRLVGSERETPSLVTFIALFGGVEVFGLEGLILGPVLVSLAMAVLRIYAREARARREAWAHH